MLCSGNYYANGYFLTECLRGVAKCRHASYNVSPDGSVSFLPLDNESQDVPYNFTHDRMNSTNLRIVKTGTPFVTHPTNPLRSGVKLSSLSIKYMYTSRAAVKFEGIDVWRPGTDGVYRRDGAAAVGSPIVRIVNDKGIPIDYWSGICDHSIERCNLTVSNGRTVSLSACSTVPFNCWERRVTPGSQPDSSTLPTCLDKIGIGEILRADTVVSSTMQNLLRETGSRDPQRLIPDAVSRLSLAWISSAMPLDLSSNLRFIVYVPVELATRRPEDAVAIDLIMFSILCVSFILVLIAYVVLCILFFVGWQDQGYERRKLRWDALEKYAALLRHRGELLVPSPSSPASSRPSTADAPPNGVQRRRTNNKKKYDKVGQDGKEGPKSRILSTKEDNAEAASSPDGSPSPLHRSQSRKRPQRSSSVRRSATLPSEVDKVAAGTEAGQGGVEGEGKSPAAPQVSPQRPIWEVLFTKEGLERIIEFFGETPRHRAPRKEYVIYTQSSAIKKKE
ncbi:hypothetical protein HDU96_009065 [Phlyctochytrium bullatum]|nr:hypothetical protein HDU96_009065 [Phlyctochytrium bullatum]